eukprot:3007653-Alexandrium_andersonii.AAC.1
MSASLVGSEMCIRDSHMGERCVGALAADSVYEKVRAVFPPALAALLPVSYTHLTLPTICSV